MMFHCKHCNRESDTQPRTCPGCNAFKPWVEGRADFTNKVLKLSEVSDIEFPRFAISPEFDEATGGGLVPGGVYLIGGEPGIGKSTLLLQTLGRLSEQDVLYISAEEAAQQIKARAERINVQTTRIAMLQAKDVEYIERALEEHKPKWCVLDSISAVRVPELAHGSIQGQREVIAKICARAQKQTMGLLVVAHETKDGDIAGPKALEHEVDCVLEFEGERKDRLRMLRTRKNRFGPHPRMGLFEMTETGLKDVENAGAALFRGSVEGPGSVLGAAWQDGRCLLLEIQVLIGALCEKPRVIVNGLPSARVSLVRAVLERFGASIAMGKEMYVSVVGGIKADDPALDLPLAMALYSAEKDIAIPKEIVLSGEVGLLGEIIQGPKWDERKRMAERAGCELKTYEHIREILK